MQDGGRIALPGEGALLSAKLLRRARWAGGVLTGALIAALVGIGTSASASTQTNVAWSSYLAGLDSTQHAEAAYNLAESGSFGRLQ